MHECDTVAIALQPLVEGQELGEALVCREAVAAGHKVAVRPAAAGAPVYKYGQVIGVATRAIAAGEHVHTHNLGYAPVAEPDRGAAAPPVAGGFGAEPDAGANLFKGYLRADGQAGTRNYIGIMATVNCSATVVARIARHFYQHPRLRDAGVDAVIPVVHQSGCGIPASGGVELSLLQRVLSGYLHNPNFCGWVLVGLGCEVNQAEQLLGAAGQGRAAPVREVTIQEVGGTSAAVTRGIEQVEALMSVAAQSRRQVLPLTKLKVGLQCGGSDGWSGVTANPALGAAVDRLVAAGGTAILAETPEIYGAEQLLLARATSPAVAARLREKIAWWQDYLAQHGKDMNNNPSPGNLAGGITTILEKSLGAVAKSGSSTLNGVLDYGRAAPDSGLLFMDSPGYDPCSVTGEIAAGANLVCFTTGRGSTFGAAGAPTLKLASNQQLFARMREDMDINCGPIAGGARSIDELGEEIFHAIIATAGGRPTASEKLGLGEYEFVPWAMGAVV
ncbi:altronate dehydratase [Exilibacterium tricleocarpae]|uniref:Altronate dehydratase n=2 Tax=Exilibacterium tricleocarpae TaxID=2591008 RepID=A0A545U783_9GAMM|nr:altronate dehydratase [Exilibacterium tricleocarpae]